MKTATQLAELESALANVSEPKGTWTMTRDEAIELARECAIQSKEGHGYLQNVDENWMPHEWGIEAIMSAAEDGARAEAMLTEVAAALDNEHHSRYRNNSVVDRINSYLVNAEARARRNHE